METAEATGALESTPPQPWYPVVSSAGDIRGKGQNSLKNFNDGSWAGLTLKGGEK